MRAEDSRGRHISGAEGIHDASIPAIQSIIKSYIARALNHPRGEPAKIVITIEQITRKPIEIETLPVSTLKTGSPARSESAIRGMLGELGVSPRAVAAALRIVRSSRVMRGAAIIDAATGRRLEPDRTRGVRTSRIGIEPEAERSLKRKLARAGINTQTVREALILASKVAHAKGVIAELCVSDDPDYTTGYVASKTHGYVRIPDIKGRASMSGGRVIFVGGTANIEKLIDYLELSPVMVGGISKVTSL